MKDIDRSGSKTNMEPRQIWKSGQKWIGRQIWNQDKNGMTDIYGMQDIYGMEDINGMQGEIWNARNTLESRTVME